MFKVEKIGEGNVHWAVFLVNRYNEKDQYRVTGLLLSEEDAKHLLTEFNRILRESQ